VLAFPKLPGVGQAVNLTSHFPPVSITTQLNSYMFDMEKSHSYDAPRLPRKVFILTADLRYGNYERLPFHLSIFFSFAARTAKVWLENSCFGSYILNFHGALDP
jgi:hypothetical protein